MKLCQKLHFNHVASCGSKVGLLTSLKYSINNHYVLKRPFCNPSDDDKKEKSKDNNSSSIFSFLKNSLSFMDNAIKNGNDDKTDWIGMYDEIKKSNEFELDIDAKNNPEQFMHFSAVSSQKISWMNVLIASKAPLRYEEFMVGAYNGFKFILQCLENDDKDSLSKCVTKEVLQQYDEMRQFLIGFDDNGYGNVDKVMSFLNDFENGPNYEDMSINAQYNVTYYYQLKCINDENDYIQKRVDMIWKATWLPGDNWTFEISDDGWIVQSVDCIDIPKSE